MSFSTLIFIAAFLPLFLFFYFLVPGIRNKNRILLLFSLIFYSFAGLGCLLLLLALGTMSWYIGEQIEKAMAAEEAVLLPGKDGEIPEKKKPGRKARRWLQGGVAALLLVLIFFKYTGLLLGTLRLPVPKLLLPLGISFYSFRLISYLADVYQKRIAAQPLFETLLYTVNFQVIGQGPIVSFPTLTEQFRFRQHTLDGFLLGLGRFLVGLAKKCLLADHLGELCESFLPLGFLSGGEATVLGAWLGGLCYMLQLYLDFAAYSDMALGLGQICGFTYPENFNYPYMAVSVRDFWRRWHISLSSFFRDYVYIPLGGNRVSFGRLCLNLLVVWSLTGIWHGASWSFLLWGWYYFLLILLENLLQKGPAALRELPEKLPKRLRSVLQHGLTLLLVYWGWVLFRFSDFASLKGAVLLMLGQGNAFGSAQVSLLLKNNLFFLILSLTAVTPVWKLLSDTIRNAADRRIQLRLKNRARISGGVYDADSERNPELHASSEDQDDRKLATVAETSDGESESSDSHVEVLDRVKERVQRQLKTAWLWEIGYYSLRTIWLLLLLLLSVMAMVGSSYQPFLYNAFLNAMKNKLNSKWKYVMTAALGGSLLGLAVLGFNVTLRPSYSVSEKRELKTFPKVSLAAVWSGDWFTELSSWFSDTFPFRESLLSGEASLEQFYGLQGEAIYSRSDSVAESIPETAAALAPTFSFDGETSAAEETAAESEAAGEAAESAEGTVPAEAEDTFETDAEGNLQLEKQDTENVDLTGEQAGNIYVSDGRAYEIYYFSQKNVTAYASMINTVQAMLPEDVTLYDMLIPNSFGVQLPENVQAKLGSSGMNEAFAYTYSLIDPAVKRVSVFDTLREHADEYIYFHTDHHWTQLGAYYAYRRFCEEKGITAHELSEYESVSYDGFYGTFYFSTNRAETLKQNPDTITAYIPLCGNSMSYQDSAGTMHEAAIINDASKMNAGNRYNCFLLGDNAYTEIQNPNLTDGSACVLVKESYGNALAPFLADHYQYLYVIDYRYYQGNLLNLIQEKGVQDVVFANNVMAVGQKASGQMMSVFK